MEILRKRFTGIANIVRFNWHFYILAIIAIVIGCIAGNHLSGWLQSICWAWVTMASLSLIVSLSVSHYIYDCSQLYDFGWIRTSDTKGIVINIHSGFDESSCVLEKRFPQANFKIWDFYDPKKHTEPSIKRARKIYLSDAIPIDVENLPQATSTVESTFLLFAAHEIRNTNERIRFFKELNRVLKPDGIVYVMEHLRDLPNFLTYSIGAFHFHSRQEWQHTFSESGFRIVSEQKHTPFIAIFQLQKHGNPH
ncbi:MULTISPECIES: class I SAM-dependent methyltransferase [Chitinophagaceae]